MRHDIKTIYTGDYGYIYIWDMVLGHVNSHVQVATTLFEIKSCWSFINVETGDYI